MLQVAKSINCQECRLSLFDVEPYNPTLARLTCMKQRGGLKYATRSVFRVIQLTDQALKIELNKINNIPPSNSNFIKNIERIVFRASTADRYIFKELYGHDANASLFNMHVPIIIKAIVNKFALASLCHRTRGFVEERKGAASNTRNNATRLLIFKGL
jgi:hypothetical protein